MIPLLVLIISFFIVLYTMKLLKNQYQIAFSARVSLSLMLIIASVGHFIYTEGMIMMIPDIFPLKRQMVYFTGVIELASALAIHIPKLRKLTGWLLIMFFMLLLPANINAAIQNINYQDATFDGNGIMYLWFRVPLQILFICWTYLSCIKYSVKE